MLAYNQPQEVEVPLRRSTREGRNAISDDYIIFLQEHELDRIMEDDPVNSKQSENFDKLTEAMNDEMKSMRKNEVGILSS